MDPVFAEHKASDAFLEEESLTFVVYPSYLKNWLDKTNHAAWSCAQSSRPARSAAISAPNQTTGLDLSSRFFKYDGYKFDKSYYLSIFISRLSSIHTSFK